MSLHFSLYTMFQLYKVIRMVPRCGVYIGLDFGCLPVVPSATVHMFSESSSGTTFLSPATALGVHGQSSAIHDPVGAVTTSMEVPVKPAPLPPYKGNWQRIATWHRPPKLLTSLSKAAPHMHALVIRGQSKASRPMVHGEPW